mgnify:CR=1 FL=1
MMHARDQFETIPRRSRCSGEGSRWRESFVLSLARRSIVVLLALMGLLGVGSSIYADEEDDDVDRVVAPVAEVQVTITVEQFDQMVFGARAAEVVREVNGVKRIEMVTTQTPIAFRERLETALATEIQWVDAQCSLTSMQKKKLGLAGKGDIHQFFSRAAELRPKLTAAPMSHERYIELMAELSPLRMAMPSGLTGENSLFRKTLRRTLTDEQRLRYQALERQRQKATIEAAMLTWGQTANGLKLTGETRQKFTELILDHGRLPWTVGSYGQYVVLLEANQLRDRMKPLLTEPEWEKFEWHVGLAKRYVPTLESSGLWTARRSDDDKEESAAAMKD